eukprot:6482641-Amphidinium_carterae.1
MLECMCSCGHSTTRQYLHEEMHQTISHKHHMKSRQTQHEILSEVLEHILAQKLTYRFITMLDDDGLLCVPSFIRDLQALPPRGA